MNCFYHNEISAVAGCKNCNRGLCCDCSAEVENGIACKNRCENEVAALNELINRNKTMHLRAHSAFARNSIIFGMLGILFGVFGLLSIASAPGYGWFMLLAGTVFLLGAGFYYTTGRKYLRTDR